MTDGPPSQTDESPAEFIREASAGMLVARALGVVAELGIADLLSDEPRTATALAEATGVHPDFLYRLLRMLAAREVFAEDEAGCFHLTPRANLLCSEVAGSVRDRLRLGWQDLVWDAYRQLPASMRNGEPAFDLAHGAPIFDLLAANPASGRAFDRAMARVSAPEDEAIAASFAFGYYRQIVDVGGGRGGLLAAIHARHPEPALLLYDRPDVVADPANLLIARQAGRCEVAGGDFFAEVPQGADLYLLKRIVHDWDDARAARILRNIREVMSPAGRVLVLEAVIRPGNARDPNKDLDVGIMVLTRGRERTRLEFERLFRQAGLDLVDVAPTAPASPVHMLEAAPAW